ncbi:MAG: Lrp/AsnC ligand binding domain-containing protein [Actinomycetota bacterium]|nr:Lrp/AsnC ligand binding domain-containing protein [Actinomycetota bacterium]
MDAVVECRRLFGVPNYIIRVAVADVARTRPSTRPCWPSSPALGASARGSDEARQGGVRR